MYSRYSVDDIESISLAKNFESRTCCVQGLNSSPSSIHVQYRGISSKVKKFARRLEFGQYSPYGYSVGKTCLVLFEASESLDFMRVLLACKKFGLF